MKQRTRSCGEDVSDGIFMETDGLFLFFCFFWALSFGEISISRRELLHCNPWISLRCEMLFLVSCVYDSHNLLWNIASLSTESRIREGICELLLRLENQKRYGVATKDLPFETISFERCFPRSPNFVILYSRNFFKFLIFNVCIGGINTFQEQRIPNGKWIWVNIFSQPIFLMIWFDCSH